MEVEMNGYKYIACIEHFTSTDCYEMDQSLYDASGLDSLPLSLSPSSATVNEMDNAMFFTLFYECIFSFFAASLL